MKPQRIVVAVLALGALALAGWLWLSGRHVETRVLTGYVEGEALYLASPVSGTLREITVRRGDQVTAGQRLFLVDTSQVGAARNQAAADLAAAQAQAIDAREGQRPAELAIFEAQIDAARAAEREAKAAYDRVATLARQGIYAQARLDDARAAYETAKANTAAAVRRLQAAQLGAREGAVRAADARVAGAAAGVSAQEARLRDLAPLAPSAARVEDVFFQAGEWVTANQPIVSLLPEGRIKLRFFVPQKDLAAYRVGRVVRFTCDGCASGMTAKIAYISPRPEFTPPVIYSRGARDRLVYLVEAYPATPAGRPLPPGLPVDVEPLAPERR